MVHLLNGFGSIEFNIHLSHPNQSWRECGSLNSSLNPIPVKVLLLLSKITNKEFTLTYML